MIANVKTTDNIAAAIAVTINGAPHSVGAQATLAELLDALGHAPERFATAVNGEFVARAERALRVLHAGDEITCFQAIVGG